MHANTPPCTLPPRLPAAAALTCTYMYAGMKGAVVDAVEELYLKAATGGAADPCQAAQNLVTLAQGSSLGQSSSLGACVLCTSCCCVHIRRTLARSHRVCDRQPELNAMHLPTAIFSIKKQPCLCCCPLPVALWLHSGNHLHTHAGSSILHTSLALMLIPHMLSFCLVLGVKRNRLQGSQGQSRSQV